MTQSFRNKSIIKIISVSILLLFNVFLIILADKFLLIYSNYKRKNFINTKNIGQVIKEGILLEAGQIGGYHHENPSDFVNYSEGEDIIWILGDSWIARLNENHFENFEEKLNKDYSTLRIFSNSSWSPLLYTLVLKNRFNLYNEKPDKVVIYLDQTDIGDDYCRYRPLVERDEKGILKRVHINKFITYNNHDFVNDNLFRVNNSGIMYALRYLVYRIFYKIRIFVPGLNICEYEDLVAWHREDQKSRNGSSLQEYENYFQKTVNDLIKELKRINPKVSILLITHEWAQHDLDPQNKNHFKRNISSIVKQVSMKHKNVKDISISTNEYKRFNSNSANIFDYPSDPYSHLKPDNYGFFADIISTHINKQP